MTLLNKINFLLTPKQKKQLTFLALLLFIGILFEMLGLGILIPALGIMLKTDIGKNYPILQPFLEFLGNPTQVELVVIGMVTLVFIYLVKAIFLVYLSWKQSEFSSELSADLSSKLFLGYMRQPYSFHLERNSAELLRNIQGEVALFTFISQSIISLTIEISIVIGVVSMLVIVEPMGAIVVTVFLGTAAYLYHIITKKKISGWGVARQFHSGLASQHLMQGLGGVKDVKLTGRDGYFLEQFDFHNKMNAKIQTRVAAVGLVPRTYLELLAVMGLAVLILFMASSGKSFELLLPVLGVFAAAAFRVIPSANRIMTALQGIRYGRPVVDMLYTEFGLIRTAEDSLITGESILFNHELAIKDISFKYPGSDMNVLDSVSLNIKKGESIAFIGPSGSGKSTLVDIILGLLKPDSGMIIVDHINTLTNIRSWQNQLGYVPQSIYLTDDSLRNNIAFGIAAQEISDIQISKAIKSAQLDEFIETLPEGLETFVGERGVRLSGGQKQRIGIARALYHDPKIMIFDEATSALDGETESGVMEAISALKGIKTVIIIAHRLSTVINCDRIYSLEKGKIVKIGSPKEVLAVIK